MAICTEHGINLVLKSNIKTLQKPNRLVFVKKATVLSMPRYNSEKQSNMPQREKLSENKNLVDIFY